MAISADLVGKFGASTVEVIPVSRTNMSGNGSSYRLYSGTVPYGEVWWVSVYGEAYNAGSRTEACLYIGSDTYGWTEGAYYQGNGWVSVSSTESNFFYFDIESYNSGRSNFTGNLYIVKL